MKTIAGLWIDHRKAVIAIVSVEGEETMEVRSNVEKQPGRLAGVRSTTPYEAQHVQADDSREREFTGHLKFFLVCGLPRFFWWFPFFFLVLGEEGRGLGKA